jgi:hypothetical protein
MKEVFVMLAKMMSKEDCIKRLQSALEQYNEAKLLGKDLKPEEDHVMVMCHLLLLNTLKGNAEDVLNQMDMVNKSVEFFKVDKNKN